MSSNYEKDIALIRQTVSYIKDDVVDIKNKMENDYVTRVEFEIVQRLVYGVVGLILTSVVVALVSLVLR